MASSLVLSFLLNSLYGDFHPVVFGLSPLMNTYFSIQTMGGRPEFYFCELFHVPVFNIRFFLFWVFCMDHRIFLLGCLTSLRPCFWAGNMLLPASFEWAIFPTLLSSLSICFSELEGLSEEENVISWSRSMSSYFWTANFTLPHFFVMLTENKLALSIFFQFLPLWFRFIGCICFWVNITIFSILCNLLQKYFP